MAVANVLLTVIVETSSDLDKESDLYRSIMSARLRWGSQFRLITTGSLQTLEEVAAQVNLAKSKYIVFMNASHLISRTYMNTMLTYLSTRNVYIAEPFMYQAAIPSTFNPDAIEDSYYYGKETGIYGYVFNTGILKESLATFQGLGVDALYTAYRIYWGINSITPQTTGYSVASVTKVGIGIEVVPSVSKLVPDIPTNILELRLYVLRLLVLFLKGLRSAQKTAVSFQSLRTLISTYQLEELVDSYALGLNPFEAGLIHWIADPEKEKFLFKELTHEDFYLAFAHNSVPKDLSSVLYEMEFSDTRAVVSREYLSKDLQPHRNSASNYDYYRRPINEDSVMIFIDRSMQADDNAEHLYRYFQKKHPNFKNLYFALSKKSDDWQRLEKDGFNLIQIFSPEYYDLFLISDAIISSQTYSPQIKGKSFRNSRFVYLQHGIQLNDMSDWVISKQFDIFVATGQDEYDYLKKLLPRETLNSGIPRLETLAQKKITRDHILFMPTWRFNLHNVSNKVFMESNYFQAINNFINDQRLIDYLEERDLKLLLQLHPNTAKRVSCFNLPKNVEISTLSYGDAIAAAELIVTDYSSAVLDGAFISKPILYYQWDFEEFFKDQPYEGRVNYRTQGLGPVLFTHNQVINYITQSKHHKRTPTYIKRRKEFFKGIDRKGINAAIVKKILEL